MLGLGIAASYSPPVLRSTEEWPKIHQWLVGNAPLPNELEEETAEVVQRHGKAIDAGYAELRRQLAAYKPDALVVLVTDSGRVFSQVQVPQFASFMGEEIWGSTRYSGLGEKAEDDIVQLKCAPELAQFVEQQLIEHEFDMNHLHTFRPLGAPEYGAPVSLVAGVRALTPKLDVPVVPIFVNAHVPPAPSGHRCYAFGQALATVLQERPERVALVAIGGLSHDHHRPRAGWVDYLLDRWVLDHMARGKGAALGPLYDVESDSVHGGVAEMRLWAAVAGACEALDTKATVVDYIAAYSAATGIGFAYWPIAGAAPARRTAASEGRSRRNASARA